ncbi:NAD-dependent epimerase/dehydratase family protein [Agromyces seonyuensis]|uniref:NAD-dependent epimerase/dehydratase family protein n=1 Tax=Agromyces seonyuensis TaxID=2662446 RepID=UPI0030148AB0
MLGGTAWLGGLIAAGALERGHEVTCVARGEAGEVPAGTRFVGADREQDDALAAVSRERWDAVVDVARQPGQVRRAVRDLEPVAGRFVFVSSCSAYASQAELGADEDAALLPALVADRMASPEDYGSAKAACEAAVLGAFGRERSFIVRPGLLGGPGDPSGRTDYWPWRFAHPAEQGRILVPDAPDLPTAVLDVRDLVAWMLRAIEDGLSGVCNAQGRPEAFPAHLAAARVAAGSDALPIPAPEAWLQEHGVAEWAGPRSLPLWLVDRDWYGMNARSIDRALAGGLELRPLVDTLRDALAHRESLEPSALRDRAGLADADESGLLAALEERARD